MADLIRETVRKPPSAAPPVGEGAGNGEESERQLRLVLDSLPVAVYATDPLGRITYFNDAAVSLWSQRPEIGRSEWCGSWKLFRPDGRVLRHDECSMALAVRERRVIRGTEAVAERPDGSRVSFTSHPTPLFDDEGRFVGAASMLVDISDRRKADELAQHMASIVESSDDAIIAKGLDGTITSWNRGAERLFGYTAEEMIGRPLAILIPEDRQDEEPTILARLRRGERIDHYETVRRRKDGGLVDISLTVSPIRSQEGIVIGASKIARDITERRLASERQQLLIGEMKHRTKNLFAVIDAIARQSRPRHQPEVEAFVDLFMGRMRALLLTGEMVLSSSDRLVDLGQLFKGVLAPFHDPARTAQVALDGPPQAITEKTAGMLGLAIHELATNALKYGALKRPEGRVSLAWSVQQHGSQRHVRIEWREQGGDPIDAEPSRVGFGSRMIRAAVAGERGGRTELRFEKDGLRCVFEFAVEIKSL
jgi:PAS domain S-box-containing protein